MPRKNFNNSGFSLVELMVAIAIIGIISAVSFGSINAIQKNGRDAQRQSDLRVIQSALQQYYADKQRYPNDLTNELANGTALTNCSGTATTPTGCTVTRTYLSKTPKNPDGTAYYFRPVISSLPSDAGNNCGMSGGAGGGGTEVGQCHYYFLCSVLESPPSGSTCYNNNYNYQLTPL